MDERIFIVSAREGRMARMRRWVLLAIALLAILFQVYVPRFLPLLAYLELPLLVALYFALLRRCPLRAALMGAAIGLAQDSLSHQPLGVFGIVKTLAGYFAASISLRFDADHAVLRWVLAYFFFTFHQFFYWVLVRALLAQPLRFELQLTLASGLLNALAAVALFHLFDRLKERA
ncbi:MAG: rod shape-determining protein MreD [Bryobacterales bacterium]|nr:rod shape-determining protein MreD [Bryobacteraceae bacterium]MDW8130599.1 rod shape-determining protein MreD [Bryobacterales bacterium]